MANAPKSGTGFAAQISQAVTAFWDRRESQREDSIDLTNRGAVLGGKQLNGFVSLLKTVAVEAGVAPAQVITDNNYLPGYFRSSKEWDMIIIDGGGRLPAAIELKSQIGSYGNNFNNRAEEALGSAVDLWTAFREGLFPEQLAPWLGWLMVVGRDDDSERPVSNHEPHFPVLAEFVGATYLQRYQILCQKLVRERHYNCASVLWTRADRSYGDLGEETSISSFLASLYGYLSSAARKRS